MVHKTFSQVSYAKQFALGICEQFSNLQNLGQTSHALTHLSGGGGGEGGTFTTSAITNLCNEVIRLKYEDVFLFNIISLQQWYICNQFIRNFNPTCVQVLI